MQTEGLLGGPARPGWGAPTRPGWGCTTAGPEPGRGRRAARARARAGRLRPAPDRRGQADGAGQRPPGPAGGLPGAPAGRDPGDDLLILTQRQRERLESEQELDCAHALPGKARFRLNVYFQRDSVGAAFRLIPRRQAAGGPRHPGPGEQPGPSAPGVRAGHRAHRVGQVDHPGQHGRPGQPEREDHIMTVEDPIEFLHSHQRCLVNQREVGETPSRSPAPSSTSCARTPTSSWSGSCEISRRSRSP
jgi:hypothetical protein